MTNLVGWWVWTWYPSKYTLIQVDMAGWGIYMGFNTRSPWYIAAQIGPLYLAYVR